MIRYLVWREYKNIPYPEEAVVYLHRVCETQEEAERAAAAYQETFARKAWVECWTVETINADMIGTSEAA